MAAIDAEIRIGGEDYRVGQRFAHPDEAGISQAHRNVDVLVQEVQHAVQLVTELEDGEDGTTPKKPGEGGLAAPPQKVESFGENGFAGFPGRGQAWQLGGRPRP